MKIVALGLVLSGLAWGAGSADEMVLPKALERRQAPDIAYRFDTQTTGRGFLDLEWSDTAGRVVERRRLALDLTDAPQVAFTLDPRRAVTTQNQLVTHLVFDEVDARGDRIHREDRQTKSFIVAPPDGAWSDYQIIMWQGQTAAGYAALKKLGVTAGMLETNHRDAIAMYAPQDLARLVDADLRCYLENIATDFYSPYHRWSNDRPENWLFLEAKDRYWANPLDRAAFPGAQPVRR